MTRLQRATLYTCTLSAILNFEKLMRGGTPWLWFRDPCVDPVTKRTKQEWRYQLVQTKFPSGCLIIIDEAHKCKGTTSLNAGLMIALKKAGYRVLTLSATQATDPTEMRAFGYLSNLHDLYHWKEWCVKNGADETESGRLFFDKDDTFYQQKMYECHTDLFNTQQIASRLTRTQMGSLFPDNTIVAQSFDLGSNSPKIQSVYEEMEQEIADLEEQTENYSGHIFAVIMKARRRAEMLKVPLFQEMFEEMYDEGKSPVVFLNFSESIEALNDRLVRKKRYRGKIGLIYGERKMKERWQDIADFNADIKRGLICNLKAGGASLSYHDLHGNFPRTSIINPSFSAIDLCQALGRIHRQGGLTPCYQVIAFASNCIEEQACRKVQLRLDNLDLLVDGDLTSGFRIH
jgi:hypothetical protein